ncbi:MAG TPA: 3-oxoacyl-ACP reductase FabG [Anaerolineae bacterium]|nr:3-oxoacyl-ACP reductase FabG [Anaerolineae bacterium]
MKLKNRVAIVTGSAEGIGKAIAVAFASEGAKVVIADINFDKARKTANEIGDSAFPVKVDVTKWDQVTNMIKKSVETFGRVDILVNNAGIVRKGWVKDLPEEVWDEVITTNLKGTFLCSKAVLSEMIKNNYGRIITISSIAGKQGEAAGSAYCSSKFGQIGFTQALALEVAKNNIIVNAICPGPIPTALGEYGIREDAKLRGQDPDEFRDWFISRTPFGVQGKPEQVAKMAVFVASDDCDFCTGSAFNCSGGIIMH